MRLLSDLLDVLRSHDLETSWTSYQSGQDLIAEVEDIAAGVAAGDPEATSRLKLLFAPTGVLQDVAIGSGFPDMYMALAARMDALRR